MGCHLVPQASPFPNGVVWGASRYMGRQSTDNEVTWMAKHSEPDSSTGGKYSQYNGPSPDAHGAQALAEVDTLLVAQAVVAVLTAGDAILFGTTRDGGAVAMQLFSGTEIDKLYGATQDELSERLRGIVEAAGHH